MSEVRRPQAWVAMFRPSWQRGSSSVRLASATFEASPLNTRNWAAFTPSSRTNGCACTRWSTGWHRALRRQRNTSSYTSPPY